MQKLIIIDGNAIFHRAYHAIPPLSAPDGMLVNAVYGFFAMLLKILEEQKPTHLVVCFDRAAPTFRQTLYAGYHENRGRMADDMVPQIVLIPTMLEQMNVALFGVDGYEADDLIGTLAWQATHMDDRRLKVENSSRKIESRKSINSQSSILKKPSSTLHHPSSDFEVIIVSGDRDMLQLVNEHVKVLMPVTGITKMVLFDEKAVEEKYGVKPKQFVDYKALIGDASDNYPGVTGIGPKTAAALLREFETFENLYHHIHSLPEKTARLLATDAEQAALAKKLATILTDAPVHLDMAVCPLTKFDSKAAQAAFEKIGIKSLQQRLPRW